MAALLHGDLGPTLTCGVDIGHAAELLDDLRASRELGGGTGGVDEVLRADAERDLVAGLASIAAHTDGDRGAAEFGRLHRCVAVVDRDDFASDEVHARRADEAGDE